MQFSRLVSVSLLVLLAGPAAALAAGEGGEPGKGYVPAYELEPVGDGSIIRITLTERAIERLGIETAAVANQDANRSFIIGGTVLDRLPHTTMAAEEGRKPAPLSSRIQQALWISFPVTESIEQSKLLPVQVRPLRGDQGTALQAEPVAEMNEPVTAEDGGMLYYELSGALGDLGAGESVLVEVPFAGNGEPHKTVPYGAIIYDHHGDEWVYVSPEDGVYERFPVDIAYIDGETAFLLEGPEVDAAIVTVGAAELLGTEQRIGY